mgnify:CR=1 FL=1
MAHRGFFHDTQWTMSTQKPPPTLTNSRLLSAIYSKKVNFQQSLGFHILSFDPDYTSIKLACSGTWSAKLAKYKLSK